MYRRLGSAWGTVVTPPRASPLAALQLLQAVARLCFAACKGPDISAERLTRRFPEVGSAEPAGRCSRRQGAGGRAGRARSQVYMAVSAVMASPRTDPGRALSEAETSIAALSGVDLNKGLAAKAVTAATGASKLGSNLKLFGGSKPRPNMTGEDAGPVTMVSGRHAATSLSCLWRPFLQPQGQRVQSASKQACLQRCKRWFVAGAHLPWQGSLQMLSRAGG